MTQFCKTILCAVAACGLVGAAASAQSSPPLAVQGLEKLKALEGDWIDVDGFFGTKGAVAVTYRVTAGGNTVVETFPVHTPEEMVTVYHLDKEAVVLTHYCSGGTQPRMRSKGLAGNVLVFDYDGGTNIDPAKTTHMHATQIEFLSTDEIRATWDNWSNGKPDNEHKAVFRVVRKK